MIVTHHDIPRVIADVNALLVTKGKRFGLTLKVEPLNYKVEDDWLYLCVRPSQEGIRPYDYAEVLEEVEKELRRNGIEQVLLLPIIEE